MAEATLRYRGQTKPCPISRLGMVIKSPTGKNSVSLPKLMGIKPKSRWLHCGRGRKRDRTISRALKKIGFTRKKKPMATVNGMKPNGRRTHAQLSTLPPSKIVYLDESGMDNRDEYGYGWID